MPRIVRTLLLAKQPVGDGGGVMTEAPTPKTTVAQVLCTACLVEILRLYLILGYALPWTRVAQMLHTACLIEALRIHLILGWILP